MWGDIKQLTYKSKGLISRDALHTIQKPEKLIERLVRASSLEGDLGLDPFAGVGTCPAVCKKNKRDYVAFELRPEFVEEAESRLPVTPSPLEGEGRVRGQGLSGHDNEACSGRKRTTTSKSSGRGPEPALTHAGPHDSAHVIPDVFNRESRAFPMQDHE